MQFRASPPPIESPWLAPVTTKVPAECSKEQPFGDWRSHQQKFSPGRGLEQLQSAKRALAKRPGISRTMAASAQVSQSSSHMPTTWPNPSVEATTNSVPARADKAGSAHSALPARAVPLSVAPHLER